MKMELPMWMLKKYAEIWKSKKAQNFTLDECTKIIKQDKAITAVILSNLRKAGLLNVEFDPVDSRKRVYSLKEPEEMIQIMGDKDGEHNHN